MERPLHWLQVNANAKVLFFSFWGEEDPEDISDLGSLFLPRFSQLLTLPPKPLADDKGGGAEGIVVSEQLRETFS